MYNISAVGLLTTLQINQETSNICYFYILKTQTTKISVTEYDSIIPRSFQIFKGSRVYSKSRKIISWDFLWEPENTLWESVGFF